MHTRQQTHHKASLQALYGCFKHLHAQAHDQTHQEPTQPKFICAPTGTCPPQHEPLQASIGSRTTTVLVCDATVSSQPLAVKPVLSEPLLILTEPLHLALPSRGCHEHAVKKQQKTVYNTACICSASVHSGCRRAKRPQKS